VAFIKQKFGIDMPRPTFSSYKSQERARQERNAGSEGAAKGRPGRKPRAAASVVAHASNGVPNMALQIEALKTLCDSLGVDQVISIAQLFRK
jgi:hypothetical protein